MNAHFLIAVRNGGFLNALHAAHIVECNGQKRLLALVGGKAAEYGFGNAAGNAEYNARAGGGAEFRIDRFRLKLVKYYAGLVDHLYKLLRGDDVIGFGYAVVHELLARTFKLLRGAGHNGHAYNAP